MGKGARGLEPPPHLISGGVALIFWPQFFYQEVAYFVLEIRAHPSKDIFLRCCMEGVHLLPPESTVRHAETSMLLP